MNSRNALEEADRLIKSLPFTRDLPCYTEPAFRRKLYRNQQQERRLNYHDGQTQSAAGFLKARQLESAIRSACLTDKQTEVFEAHLRGDTFEQIGERMGVTKQAVSKTYHIARTKVRAAYQHSPYCGLDEVFYHEVARGGRMQTQLTRFPFRKSRP